MNALIPILLTTNIYFTQKHLSLEIIKLAMYNIMQAMAISYRLIASWTKVIIMNLQILNRSMPNNSINALLQGNQFFLNFKNKKQLIYKSKMATFMKAGASINLIRTFFVHINFPICSYM